MKLVSKSLEDTTLFAKDLLNKLARSSSATVLALYGDLGSGKTTFVQELGKLLGIERAMQSPTFVIMKSYPLHPPPYALFIHIDAYRLEKADELERLNFRELLADPKNIIAIEWAERVEALLPQDVIRIRFKFLDETKREIEVLE